MQPASIFKAEDRRRSHLQQVRELRVAIGDMGTLGSEGSEHIAKAAEGLVDGAGFLGTLSLCL